MFEEDINNHVVKGELEKQLIKKRPNLSSNVIPNFFFAKDPFKKEDVQQKQFMEDLGLLIILKYLPMQFVESPQLKQFGLHL